MSDAKPLYRTTLANGLEVAYVDKGTKFPLGLTRELYEKAGHQPPFDELRRAVGRRGLAIWPCERKQAASFKNKRA